MNILIYFQPLVGAARGAPVQRLRELPRPERIDQPGLSFLWDELVRAATGGERPTSDHRLQHEPRRPGRGRETP